MTDTMVAGETSRARSLGSALLVAAITVGALVAIGAGVTMALGLTSMTSSWSAQVPARPTMAAPDSVWELPVVGDPSELPPAHVVLDRRGVSLWVEDVDRWTAAMADAPHWVVWPTLGLGLLALVPVLRGAASGRALDVRYARWLLAVAGIVTLGWAVAVGFPYLAAVRVISSGATGTPASWWEPYLEQLWWPLGFPVLMVVLAGVMHRGARAADDAAGLV